MICYTLGALCYMLRYVALRYVVLRYIMLPYGTLCYAVRCVVICYVLRYITLRRELRERGKPFMPVHCSKIVL